MRKIWPRLSLRITQVVLGIDRVETKLSSSASSSSSSKSTGNNIVKPFEESSNEVGSNDSAKAIAQSFVDGRSGGSEDTLIEESVDDDDDDNDDDDDEEKKDGSDETRVNSRIAD